MEFTKQRGYNGKKAKVTYFFFGPTPLHDHAASRLVKTGENLFQAAALNISRSHFLEICGKFKNIFKSRTHSSHFVCTIYD